MFQKEHWNSVLTAKSMAELLGACSCTALAGWKGKDKDKVFLVCC